MAQALDTLGILHQNLVDAGCDEKMTEQCMTLAKEHRKGDIFPLLSAHRTALLKAVHTDQRRIDCLDFLVYTMRKKLKETAM